jgi:hypothetical protein
MAVKTVETFTPKTNDKKLTGISNRKIKTSL